jgi:hypothetical protein
VFKNKNREMMKKFLLIITILFGLGSANAFSQSVLESTRVSGNFQFDAQSYGKDSLIGAQEIKQKVLSNGFLNVLMSVGKFNGGIRYEHYLDPILGIDTRYAGSGIPYRFFEFKDEFIDVTVGNFYQQFGSGLVFRSYEERVLGLDNAMDGARFKIRPSKGVEFIGIIGNQREFWGKSAGLIRGGDLTVSISDLFENLLPKGNSLNVGGSYVSKYQDNNDSYYLLPANVTATAVRANYSTSEFNIDAEYAYKINDPNATNNYNYNPGTGFILNLSYFPEGFGANLNFHRIDNFDFRSDREAIGSSVMMSFVPPITKQHDYRLTTLFPYSTKLNGEIGVQGDFTYSFPKGSWLGGNYESYVTFNFARVHNLDTVRTLIDTTTKLPLRYEANSLGFGKNLFFNDLNIEFTKKWDRKIKTVVSFINIEYNKDVLEAEGAAKYGMVHSNTLVGELEYKFTSKHSLRTQVQHLWQTQDSTVHVPDNQNGNWIMFFAEYSYSPSWIFTVYDEYNYGNHFDEKKLHYLNFNVAYTHESSKIMLSYGRQRGGLLCVGGVCRVVPAATGISLSITSSF